MSVPVPYVTQPPFQWVPGAPAAVVKQLGCEVDLSGAEVKNKWSCSSALALCVHDALRDNFTLKII